ncbi:hypothetical protein [Glacieibacterium frigidum]|uniref:Lipoprotein n=1 Tax=Glacieibacterium frigidum TaxID=2593303 RepID=A0A552UGG7_9SPHN|nr:hypothetical protein [Glacieibacterium frigidum]TRW17289.1 hypothetical protein FMM06_03650 [Glacieibacterium frigidum]
MKATGLAMLLVLAGCGSAPPPPTVVKEAASATPVADAWAGKWVGPEGLVMGIVAEGDGRYRLTNQYTLDDKGVFEGRIEGDALVVDRAGQTVSIRKGTGDETGMKWLAGKQDCLVVGPGEGYCRG